MNRKRRRRRRFALLVLLAMILAAALGIQFRIRPMLRAIAEIQVVNAASSALAGAVNRQMAEGTADYGGLISFEKDETGQITAAAEIAYFLRCFRKLRLVPETV